MEEKYQKYAQLLLKKCLNIKKGQPLVLSMPMEAIELARIIVYEACKMGIVDIHFDWYDGIIRHTLLSYVDTEDLKRLPLWNKEVWDEYAKKEAAFLMFTGSDPSLNSDIDSKKLSELLKYQVKSRPIYKEMQKTNKLNWCIAAASVDGWAKKVFPDSSISKKLLWDNIFEICQIKEANPIKAWDSKIKLNKLKCEILNELKLKKLIFTNSLGTNLEMGLPKDHIWLSAGNGTVANMPTEEVFSLPHALEVRGKVYNSKPLSHGGVIIDDFMIEFKDGKVIDFKASVGYNALKHLIEDDENANMLGEVALVNYDSPISNSGIVFYDTLYDENASCHIALGSSYPECLKDGINKDKKELQELGANQSDTHVDFMIGTKDLKIIGIDYKDNNIIIFENGNFNKSLL